MKFEMNGYEIEIKARYISEWAPRKMNKQDTLNVLNQICIWAQEASELEAMRGCNAMARASKEATRTIYDYMESKGAFKGL